MSAAAGQQGAQGQPRPTLSVFDAVTMIVGLIVGAGIFGTPAIVAGASGSEALMIAAWVAGGLFAIIGALSVLGVAIGVVVANEVSERVLEVAFAALALGVAAQLVVRARARSADS